MSLRRLLAVWLLLAVIMTANGLFRELALVPTIDRAPADIVSAMIGIGLILGVTGLFFGPLIGAPVARLARVALLLVGLTVAFELVVGHYVDGKSWSELAANYAIWQGRLWPVVLLSLGVSPFLWGRWVPGEEPRMPRAAQAKHRPA